MAGNTLHEFPSLAEQAVTNLHSLCVVWGMTVIVIMMIIMIITKTIESWDYYLPKLAEGVKLLRVIFQDSNGN